MHHWNGSMWAIFIIASLLICASYVTIAFVRQFREKGALSWIDFLFILFCGLDHAVMAGAMFDLHVTNFFPAALMSILILVSVTFVMGVSIPSAVIIFKTKNAR